MTLPKIGRAAPQFSLADQDGKTHRLSAYKGSWVLLYFYPKDDTPGCTKQACAIRDEFPAFKKLGCVVFGISTDTEKSHKKFEAKYDLPFTLLADPDKKAVEALGVFMQEHNLPGGVFDDKGAEKEMNTQLMNQFGASHLIVSSSNFQISLNHNKIDSLKLDEEKITHWIILAVVVVGMGAFYLAWS